jgi:hypothetical protein
LEPTSLIFDLKSIDDYDALENIQQEDSYLFNINQRGLTEENYVSNFVMDGETLMIEGIENQADYQVNSVIYNQVAL